MHLLLYPESNSVSPPRHVGRLIVAAILVLLIGLLWRSVFFVDESEYAYITQFGRPLRFCEQAGLYTKWPYQSLRRFDRRLQLLEPPAREMLTADKENLNFAWFACWRLPLPAAQSETRDDVEPNVRRFLESLGNVEVAHNRLEERIQSAVAAEIGQTRLNQLVSLKEDEVDLAAIGDRVAELLRPTIRDQFGVDLVEVRLKQFNYPEAVKPAVFAEIRSERERVAVQYRSQGASEKAKIQSLADLQRDQLLAQAKREALTIRGAGEAKAIEISNEAHSQDPKFYELLKTLETYRSMLDDQTTLVLSADSPFLRLLSRGLPDLPPPAASTPPTVPPQ